MEQVCGSASEPSARLDFPQWAQDTHPSGNGSWTTRYTNAKPVIQISEISL